MSQFLLFFCLSSSSSLSQHSLPSTGCLPTRLPLHPLVPPLPPAPTLKVKFALGALQKDRTHRVQIVVAVTAQGPSACLCDLEWTSRGTDMRHIPFIQSQIPAEQSRQRKTLTPSPWLPPEHLAFAKGHACCHQVEDKKAGQSGRRQKAQALSMVLHRVALSNIGTSK